jgi:hypothetical protein
MLDAVEKKIDGESFTIINVYCDLIFIANCSGIFGEPHMIYVDFYSVDISI